MNAYEVMYIIDGTVAENVRDEEIKKYEKLVEKADGKVESVEKMGNKKLAYPINYKNDGFFVLMKISADSKVVNEITYQMKISDKVIRYMISRIDEKREAKLQEYKNASRRQAREKKAVEVKEEQSVEKTEE